MRLHRHMSTAFVAISISLAACLAAPNVAFAQGAPQVSMVTLQVVPGQGGQENVITPRGMSVPLPGAGVNGSSVQIYMGSQGGYWYIDRNGQNVDLTGYVQQMRSMTGGGQTGQAPQYAPAPQAPVQIVNEPQSSSSSSGGGGGGSGFGTAAAAGLGAMAGAAIGGSYNNGYYNNVPYGTPVYYPHGGNPYYVNASGNSVNVNHSYTGAQGNTAAAVQPNTTAYNNAHADNMQKQQQWYENQKQQNPKQWQSWQQNASGENPFVNADNQGRRGRFGGEQTANDEGGGRFGRRGSGDGAAANEGGGRFGRGEGGGGGGGGLFNREGGGGGGGRLGGGAAGGGGGRLGRRGGR